MVRKKFITVRLLITTHNRLARFGKKSETFDDVIIRLLDRAEGQINYRNKKKGVRRT